MKIWIAEDKDSPTESGFARTKYQAERYVARNRGYRNFKDAVSDGWAKPAKKIEVPKVVGLALLNACIF